jgi:hypothetical protein
MGVNRRLFNQYFITQDEVDSNVKKVESINERILALSKLLSDYGLETHRKTFVKFTEWIGVHENPTADYEKNRRWVNLPSQELVGYLNRLRELAPYLHHLSPNHVFTAGEVSNIIIKLQATPF